MAKFSHILLENKYSILVWWSVGVGHGHILLENKYSILVWWSVGVGPGHILLENKPLKRIICQFQASSEKCRGI